MSSKRKLMIDESCKLKKKPKNLTEDERNQSLSELLAHPIDKYTCWNNEFIELFHNEVKRVTLNNENVDLNLFSKYLEFGTNIYGVKVDSLYLNVQNKALVLKDKKVNLQAEQSRDQPTSRLSINPRRKRSTVVQNPETLNKPLDYRMNPHILSNNTFFKLSSLLLNTLTSKNSAIKFPNESELFWDSNENFEESQANIDNVVFVDNYDLNNTSIRTSLNQYELTDSPLDEELIVNCSQMDLCCEYEEMEEVSKHIINQDSGYMSEDISLSIDNTECSFNDTNLNNDSLGINDSMAINSTAQTSYSTMPTSSEVLEYSYQSTDEIDSWFSGPDHWKPHSKVDLDTCEHIEKIVKKRKTGMYHEITIDSIERQRKLADDVIRTGDMNTIERMVRYMQKSKDDSLKLEKLPINLFDSFSNLSPDFDINTPILTTLIEKQPEQSDDYIFDFSYNDVMHENSDQKLNISQKKVIKIDRFKNAGKTINMRLIKETVLKVIETKTMTSNNSIKFSALHEEASKLLKQSKSSFNTALIFQGLLHNASNNEKLTISSKFGDVTDFTINFEQ